MPTAVSQQGPLMMSAGCMGGGVESVSLSMKREQEGVEVPQEEGEDAPQLPLEGDAGMVVLHLSDGLEQRRTHQAQQRHDELQLWENHRHSPTSTHTQEHLGLNRVLQSEWFLPWVPRTSFFSYQLRSVLLANSCDLLTTK
ncbi:hypothetical protein EYF80_055702 [Liparis tanakae]|uniref:Uncharacterized protein n=1 Tax=Liparis tanakae TaxID=230148 RepID=A0A4Z2EZ54_9TELE|nr:hypothetical protein EYF80_055702 [Liparis tanakae]